MKTTWTLLTLAAGGALLWGGIVAQPWAVGQEPGTPVSQPAPAVNIETVDVHGPMSDPFGQTTGYTVTYAGREQADPVVAKAQQMERKLQKQTREFVAEFANTTNDEQRSMIKKALADLLTQQFELQKEVREKELTRLEDKVKKLRDLLDKRTTQRDEIVKRRVDQLVIEADGLGWLDSPSNGMFDNTMWRGEAYYPAAPVPAVAPPAFPATEQPPLLPPTPAPPPVAAPSGVR